MKHRILATVLLVSSLSILFGKSITIIPSQDAQEPANNPITMLCEKPGGNSNNISDEEDINSI